MKNKLFKNLMLPCFLFLGGIIYAQSVSGVVSDASGPIAGVNVLVKGTTNGSQTDFDGLYSLNNVPQDAVLSFSYVGFKTQEVSVNGQSTINITMLEDTALLDEVVVIGYGTTTIKDATGSVTAVTADQFNGGVISSPEQLIQGKAAGVQISSSSGEPGAGIAVRIRGTASVRSNNNPLFVVDGIPLSDGGTPGGADLGASGSSAKNPLSFLNPNDIESMTILKDASATAIYGSRGANGVIIITTKSGKKGTGGVFEFTSNQSRSSVAKTYDLLNRNQYLGAIAQYGGDVNAVDFHSDTNWQNVIFRDVISTNNSLSYANNYGPGFVRASFSYGKQLGVIENSSQERITGRINGSHKFFDEKLKIDANVSYSRVNDESPFVTNGAGSQGDLLGATYFANPTWPNDPGFTSGDGKYNPRQLLDFYQDLSNTDRVLLNGSAEYSIVESLKAKVNLGYDESTADRSQILTSQVDGFNNGTPGNGRGALQSVNVKNQLMDLTLTYNKDFGNSNLEALVGYSYQSFQNYGTTINGFGLNSRDFNDAVSNLRNSANLIDNAIDVPYQQFGYGPNGLFINQIVPDINSNVSVPTPSGILVKSITGDTYNNTDELQSYFTRLNYKIADKYLFTFTLRADGSTRFGPNNQYGYFPSGAFAWKLQDEDFIPETFSTLKLRLGYGITGNQDGLGYGNFTPRQRFGGLGIGNGGEVNPNGSGFVAFANPDLKWEETAQAGIGFDFGFFNDRLNGSIDVYHKKTKDLLLQQETAQPSPVPFVFSNLPAKVINKGIEFALNYDVIQQDDITWNVGFNISYNKNEVQDFDGLIQTGSISGNGLTGAYAQLLAEGHPLFSFYLREFGGFDANGISIYPNGDKQEFVGKSALPDYIVGISTSLSYKRFDFNAFLAGQYGQYVYNNTANAFFTAGVINSGQNVTVDVLTNGESAANAPDVSTRFLEKGDFLRLQNVSVGYNLPFEGAGFFKTMRFSLTGQNLFVITPYSGLDPEVDVPKGFNNIPSAGIDYTSYPRAKTYTFGINATF
ncbi:MAG: SusC/RagA family TonB-linked outer membrane protein [Aquaticitalea sp.]